MALNYLTRVLLGLDQFANTLIGGFPDETMSARAGRLRSKPGVGNQFFWRPLAWSLDHIQRDHVEEAEVHETDGTQQDRAYREAYKAETDAEINHEVIVKVVAE